MTCIVALEFDDKVYVGGDSASVTEAEVQITAQPKVFGLGEIVIGYTSSFRMGQLLQYDLQLPNVPSVFYWDNDKSMTYLVTQFIPAVRECFSKGGYTHSEGGRESAGFFIVGLRGRAYMVASDFQVTRMADGFVAVGSGSTYAMGALAVMTKRAIKNPEQVVRRALDVAARFSVNVRGPFDVLSA